ncbi:glycosyltransferase family 2 protein [Tumidithrix elongata RA019]|uniref:Glycosyltransferase family 2 protein n=1 Tax=Tumidithrix elongata BACA0141 TaxID=2716417 RepID=A0AAW9PU03_9CYAN|nr:glycosyltransferase family 2 protein [Tumidithrix elongata RA019]
MSINESLFPRIYPVAPNLPRPFWSVIVPAYNRPDHLAECLESVLAQALSPEEMQILVIDDCSPTDLEKTVQEIGKGRVEYYRHSQNHGNSFTFNTGLQKSTGQWIHLLHDDDWVLPNFYRKFQRSLLSQPETVGAACCRYAIGDSNRNWICLSELHRSTPGILQDWLSIVAVNNPLSPPAVVIKRKAYEHLGGYHCFENGCGEDWEVFKRVASFYDWWYETEVLATYRHHQKSITSAKVVTGVRTSDLHIGIDITNTYLPENLRAELTAQAKRNYALMAFGRAVELLNEGIPGGAIGQIQAGLMLCSEPAVVKALFEQVLTKPNAENLRQAIAEILLEVEPDWVDL